MKSIKELQNQIKIINKETLKKKKLQQEKITAISLHNLTVS